MKFSKYIVAGCVALMGVATSCVGDLDLKPNDPNIKLELTTVAEWDGYLARLYGGTTAEEVDHHIVCEAAESGSLGHTGLYFGFVEESGTVGEHVLSKT